LDADCNQPVGVLAVIDGSTMKIRGQIFDLGATTPHEGFVEGPSEDAEKWRRNCWSRFDREHEQE